MEKLWLTAAGVTLAGATALTTLPAVSSDIQN